MKPYLYRRVFHCAQSGGVITIETQKGNNYLRCTKKKGPCSQPFVREDSIDKQINAAIAAIVIPYEWIDEMLAELVKEKSREHSASECDRQALHQQLIDIDSKQKRITDAYAEGILTLDELRQTKSDLIDAKTLLKERLAAFAQRSLNLARTDGEVSKVII